MSINKNVIKFIDSNWDKCIRENRTDIDDLIGLPYPYSVPNTGCFDEMYYWDTYFTNVGLILSGRAMQAKFNVDNMLYLVNRFGFIPNGTRTRYLSNTQPPFLSEMVMDIYTYYKDKSWLMGAYPALKKEYDFWITNRICPSGLNIYSGNELTECRIETFSTIYNIRTGYEFKEEERKDIAHHCLAVCESGWDMTPRFEEDAYNYAPVDLNSLMYGYEMNMAYFASELGENSTYWEEKAKSRKHLMLKYMTSPEGILLDYNFKQNKLSKTFSMASVYPLFTGMADDEYAKIISNNISRIKGDFGVFACEKSESNGIYQWDYPNGWPCLQFIAIKGFDNYGYTELASEIAKGYVNVIERNFETTQNLWEKYNMCDGNIDTLDEHGGENRLPEMMGWTAGAYLYAKHFINEL